jgi:hypothetical protein
VEDPAAAAAAALAVFGKALPSGRAISDSDAAKLRQRDVDLRNDLVAFLRRMPEVSAQSIAGIVRPEGAIAGSAGSAGSPVAVAAAATIAPVTAASATIKRAAALLAVSTGGVALPPARMTAAYHDQSSRGAASLGWSNGRFNQSALGGGEY